MPNERISMSKLKQLIGLQTSNLSVRALGRALGLSVGAVSKYLRAVRACGVEAAEESSGTDNVVEFEALSNESGGQLHGVVPLLLEDAPEIRR